MKKFRPILFESPWARFVGGTIVLENIPSHIQPPDFFHKIQCKWRAPAYHYRAVRTWLRKQHIRDRIPRWQKLPKLSFRQIWTPHDYQTQAIDSWREADGWGSVVLPTGAGKTFVALQAIAQTGVSTLIVVPTIDLLHQWYACLDNAFGNTGNLIGVWYGQEKEIGLITVTTYPSAWSYAEILGDQFGMIVFDEVHHLPTPSWHEICLMCAATYRLGLTATYPESIISSSLISKLDELVGPVVYQKSIDELTGKQLAEYRTQRIRIDLNKAERLAYDTAHDIYIGYVRKARLQEQYGPGWWNEFTRRSAYDAQARRAKKAELKIKDIVHQAQAKLEVLVRLLQEHRGEQMLIFTAHNRFAYQVARQYLIPAITHQTKAAERKEILDNFRSGAYQAIVTTDVLNEGIDVPEAKIAVVLGGNSSTRKYVQRLGRVLRKKGNVKAVLYEVIARKTIDKGIAQRRRRPYRNTK